MGNDAIQDNVGVTMQFRTLLEAQEADADGDVELEDDGNNIAKESDNSNNKSAEDAADEAEDNAEDGTNKATVEDIMSASDRAPKFGESLPNNSEEVAESDVESTLNKGENETKGTEDEL